MRVWILAGLFTAAAVPLAAAAETTAECEVDDTRRAVQQREETPVAAPPAARPTVAQREGAAPPARPLTERRRNGKRIPDAELIGPRGAL